MARRARGRRGGVFGLAALLAASAGCGSPVIRVDTRLAADAALWTKLDGPRYAITAEDERTQASLAFEEAAGLWAQVLKRHRPQLRRVSNAAEADVTCTLYFNIVDLGTGIATYPVYGWSRGFVPGWGGHGYAMRSYEVVGTEVQTYHRGYDHLLVVAAWVPDPSQPAGRRTIWEGQANQTIDEPSLKQAMPYLAAALGPFFGQATSRPTNVRIDRDDLPALPLGGTPAARASPRPFARPARPSPLRRGTGEGSARAGMMPDPDRSLETETHA